MIEQKLPRGGDPAAWQLPRQVPVLSGRWERSWKGSTGKMDVDVLERWGDSTGSTKIVQDKQAWPYSSAFGRRVPTAKGNGATPFSLQHFPGMAGKQQRRAGRRCEGTVTMFDCIGPENHATCGAWAAILANAVAQIHFLCLALYASSKNATSSSIMLQKRLAMFSCSSRSASLPTRSVSSRSHPTKL
eukprot:scaffold810_cov355-Pavlova_lutheri.AAC.14